MDQGGFYRYVVEGRDIDYTGHAGFVALCNYLLQAAGEDADLNGFGVRDLNCGNCSWVISRMAVEFYRRIEQYEELTVRTWVSEVNRMMTTRNMTVWTGGGEKVGAAVTQWAIIDIDTRKPLDLRSHIDYEGKVVAEESPIGKPIRLGPVVAGKEKIRNVAYSDMDFNRHVNSMKYAEWMLDMVSLDRIENKFISRADINFLHEAVYGQKVVVKHGESEGSHFEVENSDGAPLCRASFRWADI